MLSSKYYTDYNYSEIQDTVRESILVISFSDFSLHFFIVDYYKHRIDAAANSSRLDPWPSLHDVSVPGALLQMGGTVTTKNLHSLSFWIRVNYMINVFICICFALSSSSSSNVNVFFFKLTEWMSTSAPNLCNVVRNYCNSL